MSLPESVMQDAFSDLWVAPIGGDCSLDDVEVTYDADAIIERAALKAHDAEGCLRTYQVERVDDRNLATRDGEPIDVEHPITHEKADARTDVEAVVAWLVDAALVADAGFHRGSNMAVHDRWGGEDLDAMFKRAEIGAVSYDIKECSVRAARDGGGLKPFLDTFYAPIHGSVEYGVLRKEAITEAVAELPDRPLGVLTGQVG